jgi:ribonuclease E
MATVYMAKKMLIDATHLEETRVVVADGNKVDEFDFESINKRQLAGNIYLAKVTRVEPSLQAAFVDYGGNRHGFLAFSEIHPDYYQIPVADRQALLNEEAAEAERSSDREDRAPGRSSGGRDGDGEEKPKARSRRGKRRTRSNPDDKPAEDSEVRGLEVIELADEPSDGGHIVADAPEPAAREIKGLEISETPTDDTDEDSGAIPPDDTTPEEDDSPRATPRSIAESAGLDDDDDKVSEDIPAAAEGDAAVESDAPKPKPTRTRAKRTPKKATATEAASEDADTTQAASEEPAAKKAAPKKPAARKPRAKKAPVAAVEGDADIAASVEADAAEPVGDAPTDDTAAKPAKRAPARGRRARADDESEALDVVEVVESVGLDDTQEEAANARAKRRSHYKIQDVVKVRQIMLVQVVKEERGNKGAALTTYLSLAGRYCVLMPNTARGGGISRKISNPGDRKRLRNITDQLDVPKGMGLIVRTAGAERTEPEIKRDYEFLIRQWEQVRELTLKSIAPALIYEEGSLIKRSIRDLYSNEIDTILVEGEAGFREAHDYMSMLMPSHAKNVQLYDEQIPLYIRYQVESYLNAMFNPTVQLRSGGYIVIDVTEALVAVDVNSGRSTKESSIEDTALKTNLEAAEEVARQLRLRDLAGLIVIDFIDMDDNRNNRAVEKRMKDRLKSDRARIQVGRISAFGLMEMSRQRLRPGMIEATTQPCKHCLGQGIVRSDENLALSIMREIEEEGVRGRSAEVTVTTPIGISNYIMNMKRAHLAGIETRYGMVVTLLADPLLISPEFRIERAKVQSRQLEVPDAVITVESVAATSSVDAVDVQVTSTPDQRPADTRAPDERSGERSGENGEGRSRRRRGKRGGQRRRREEGENGAEGSAAQPAPSTDAAESEASNEIRAEETDGTGAESGSPDERRSRRRRGGRGRSRRPDEEAVSESVAAGSEPAETAAVVPDQTEPLVTDAVADAPIVEPAVETPAIPEAAGPETAELETAEPEISETETVEPDTIEEPLAAPVSELEPEPLAAAPAEPEPEKPAAPKRRGWWARG